MSIKQFLLNWYTNPPTNHGRKTGYSVYLYLWFKADNFRAEVEQAEAGKLDWNRGDIELKISLVDSYCAFLQKYYMEVTCKHFWESQVYWDIKNK